MARQKAHIHYLYKTTCLITGRYYIGMHSTNNLEDGYMGSGKRLRYSMRKHGIDNHKKEVLEFFETRELLIEAEVKAITPDMITDNNCMNIVLGGKGFTSEYAKICVEMANKKIKFLKETNPEWVEKRSDVFSEARKKEYNNGFRERKYFYDWTDKNHTIDTKIKIGKINSLKQKGSGNSQHGTCWITKDGLNKKIKKEEVDTYLSTGWVKGRIIK